MAMKSTELHKRTAEKLLDRVKKASPGQRFGVAAGPAPDRREQRRLDQAAGLVPFAVKLNRDLVAQLHAHAENIGQPLNEAVAALLRKGLERKD